MTPIELTCQPAIANANKRSLLPWLQSGWRAARFLPIQWRERQATPTVILRLVVLHLLVNLLIERLCIVGDATFRWQPLTYAWFGTVAVAWLCLWLCRPVESPAAADDTKPNAATLFAVLMAQALAVAATLGVVWIVLVRSQWYSKLPSGGWAQWAIYLTMMGWPALAQLTLLWRVSRHRQTDRALTTLALVGVYALSFLAPPPRPWKPVEPALSQPDNSESKKYLDLTQDLMEAQPELLSRRLSELRPQRKGVVDLYAITFAPYSDEEVFRKESDMVAKVMDQRFGAAGRSIQLVNNIHTVAQWPWATPKNFKRTIARVAALMNRDEDVLFIHLTSHGAKNGELSSYFWPMTVEPISPAMLKAWLDEAGIRNRVISVSACYSGTWIKPLADEHTLIMTASDATHTAYGCGEDSELTYFGRAVFDEQLRTQTLSFEQAFEAATQLIKRRETEAHKKDGFSNPQIRVGPEIKTALNRLQSQLTSASLTTH